MAESWAKTRHGVVTSAAREVAALTAAVVRLWSERVCKVDRSCRKCGARLGMQGRGGGAAHAE